MAPPDEPAVRSEPVISLPSFPEFQLQPDNNVGQRWEKYLKRFERLLTGLGITNNARKRALLLHFSGQEVDDIFDTLADTGDDDNYDKAKKSLTDYFSPKRNVAFEVFQFRKATQAPDETIDTYQTRLRQLAKTCDFHDR